MLLSDAIKRANWLSDNFRAWLHTDKQEGRTHVDQPVSKFPPEYIHISSLADCPKRAALKRHDKLKEVKSDLEHLRMQEGTEIGKAMVAFVSDLSKFHNINPARTDNLYYYYEYQQFDDEVKTAGRMDIVGWNGEREGLHVEYWLIEVKMTDAFKFGGVAFSHWAQTAGYIRYLRRYNSRDSHCNVGFIFTLYDKKEAGAIFTRIDEHGESQPMAWQVWTVWYDEQLQGYKLYNMHGQPVAIDGRNFLSDGDIDTFVMQHRYWDERVKSGEDLTDETPFMDPADHWMCARVIPADPRQRAYMGEPAGSPKKGTGIVYINCPIFAICWRSWLLERGINPDGRLPRELRLNG